MCIFVPYAKSWGKKAESSVQYEAWDTVLEGAHEKEPRKYEMEDTKKQSDQDPILPPGQVAGSPAEEPDFHLVDFWEILSELRI